MKSDQKIFASLLCGALGYCFLYFDLRIGSADLLPNFLGMLLLLGSIRILKKECRDLALLQPFAAVLIAWYGADWVVSLFGVSLEDHFLLPGFLVGIIALYFHFQLITDLAIFVPDETAQGAKPRSGMLRCRTIQTLVLSLNTVLLYLEGRTGKDLTLFRTVMAVISLAAGILIIVTLFASAKQIKTGSLS